MYWQYIAHGLGLVMRSCGIALCAFSASSVHTRQGGATLVDMSRGHPGHHRVNVELRCTIYASLYWGFA
eukprot:3858403-Pyramimonas_sp.AAC.1